tara:strand:- start:669 stop:845 length:177 start_codon:yes stop_codon:yes gene_type:complete
MFIYSLANELKLTVNELCNKLTIEEMVGWAAFFELKYEQQKKDDQQVQQRRSVIPKSR